jgi:flavin reductase (DIM6/NTAB) family NADH-FMN oxidoreductase RutF
VVPSRLPRRLPFCLNFSLLHCGSRAYDVGMAINPYDYYVVTSRTGERPDRWSWEILRKSNSLGIKMTGDGFQSEMAAQFAGKRALADFMSELLKEEKRK